MATRKRRSSRSSRSGLVGRAVSAGRNALREAESRVPPDLRRQLERTIKEGQKTLKATMDQLQAQVRSRARQADVDKALKRLDSLSKQVQQIARGASSRGAARASSTRRRAKTATRRAPAKAKTATRRAPAKAKTAARSTKRKAATRKPATRKASPRRTAAARPSSSGSATRRTAPRRPSTRRASSAPAESSTPETSTEPSWMPASNDSGETSS